MLCDGDTASLHFVLVEQVGQSRYDFGVLRVEVFAFFVADFHVVELAGGIIRRVIGIIIAAGALMEEQFPFALADGKFAFGRVMHVASRMDVVFWSVRAGKMLQLSSPAFSGSERPVMSAAVAMRSVRHTISSLKDPAATFSGQRAIKGMRCPPSQLSRLQPRK